MAGRGLPLRTDPAISQISMVSGSGAGLEAQAAMFSRIADAASSIAQPFKKQAEEDAGNQAVDDYAAATATTPEGQLVPTTRRDGFLGMQTSIDRAYNNMLEALSLDRAKRDVSKAMIEQRAKNFGNVDGYAKAMNGWQSGYLKSAPGEILGELQVLLSGQIEAGASEVLTDRVTADIAEARQEMDAGLDALMSDAETLLKDGIGAMDSDGVRALTQQITDRLDIKAGNPLYGYSDGMRELDSRAMADRLMTASLVPEVRKAFDEGGYSMALDAADALSLGLNRDEAATSAIRTRLRQEANLMNQNFNARQEATREKERADAAAAEAEGRMLDQRATRTIYDAKATVQQRVAAVEAAAPYITGDRFSTLYRLAVKGPAGEDGDGGLMFAAMMSDARKGLLTEEEAFELAAQHGMSGSNLNRVLDELATKSDKDLRIGESLISGAFARSPFSFNDFGALAAAEAEASEDLRRWRTANPEASANEVAQEARVISALRGRAAAVAMLSEVNARAGDLVAPESKDISARMDQLVIELGKTPAGTSKANDLKRQYLQLEVVNKLLERSNGPGITPAKKSGAN